MLCTLCVSQAVLTWTDISMPNLSISLVFLVQRQTEIEILMVHVKFALFCLLLGSDIRPSCFVMLFCLFFFLHIFSTMMSYSYCNFNKESPQNCLSVCFYCTLKTIQLRLMALQVSGFSPGRTIRDQAEIG